jgi:hypothetical protein
MTPEVRSTIIHSNRAATTQRLLPFAGMVQLVIVGVRK